MLPKIEVTEISENIVPENSIRHIDQLSIACDRRVGVGPLKRYDFEDMVNYALQVAEEVDPLEPSTYKEAVSSSEFA